ncbi:hypothetical protein TNCV_4419021 [Trichonephila clavipes]|nr:hypothetical protein TNCV_4419021 [Trichonephila clavipes]
MRTRTFLTLIVELQPTGIAIDLIAVLMLASVEIQRLLAEYGIDGFRMVIRSVMLYLKTSLPLAVEKIGMLPVWP